MLIRRVAVASAVLLTGLALTPHAGAATKKDRCKAKGAVVLAQQGQVRLLKQGRDYLACYGKAKPFFVFDGASNERAYGLTLAGGRYIALVDRRIAPVDGIPDVDLQVTDVKTRSTNRAPLAEGVGSGVQLALTPSGVAAVKEPTQLTVLRAAKGAEPVVVAYAADVSEVAAGPKTIYWQSGGTLHSTPADAPVAAVPPAI